VSKEERLLRAAVKAVVDKKGSNPVILDLREVSSVTDYFLIVSGSTARQVKAMAEAIDEEVSKEKVNPLRTEGVTGAKWILMDYGDFVVHLFEESTRAFYDLERLWRHVPSMPAESFSEGTP
jgi:ribosome-associated protein